jgi:hypothetical protein
MRLLPCVGIGQMSYRGRGKSRSRMKASPQRLKPFLLLITYVRAEARTLQKSEFFRSLYIRKENVLLAQLKKGFKKGQD